MDGTAQWTTLRLLSSLLIAKRLGPKAALELTQGSLKDIP